MKRLDSTKLSQKLTARAEDDLLHCRIGCAELLIRQDGAIVFHERFGTNGTNGPALPEHTVFRIASMTKPVTAAALLQQVDAGRVSLLDPVSKYIPGFASLSVGHREGEAIVRDRDAVGTLLVYQLLCHANGIGTTPFAELQMQKQPRDTLENVVNFYAEQPLAFDPYTSICYSESAAFDTAARIVELVSGESYGQYLQNHIFGPLGMTDTTFAPTEDQWKRVVVMHARNADALSEDFPMDPGCVYESLPTSITCAGAGLVSTAEDYSRFAEMLLCEGTSRDGVRVLSETAVRRMRTPHVPEFLMPGEERWGLGVRVVTEPINSHGLYRGTFGWSGAYGTHFFVDPVNRITAVYLRNSQYDSCGCGSIGVHFEEDVSKALIND